MKQKQGGHSLMSIEECVCSEVLVLCEYFRFFKEVKRVATDRSRQ